MSKPKIKKLSISGQDNKKLAKKIALTKLLKQQLSNWAEAISQYNSKRMLVILILGFSSGLPLLLTSSVLAYWLSRSGISIETIGILSSVGMPYALKFLWSPLLDKIRPPLLTHWLGQRRAVIILTQLGLITCIVTLGHTTPTTNLLSVVLLSFGIAIFSASQDMMVDAIRVEILNPKQQASGSAMSILGYRLAMTLIGFSTFSLSEFLPKNFGISEELAWQWIFIAVAIIQAVGLLGILLCRAEWLASPLDKKKYTSFKHYLKISFWYPFRDFFVGNQKAVAVLLFIVFYKYGDVFMGTLAGPFYNEAGFTGTEIAEVVKLFGLIMTLLGTFLGGSLVYRYGLYRILWIGGILQAAANLMYVWMAAYIGDAAARSLQLLTASIIIDNLSAGIATAALVAFIANLVNRQHTVTQLALLTSFAAIGRSLLVTPSGFVVMTWGWQIFFTVSILLSIPGMLLLWLLKNNFNKAI